MIYLKAHRPQCTFILDISRSKVYLKTQCFYYDEWHQLYLFQIHSFISYIFLKSLHVKSSTLKVKFYEKRKSNIKELGRNYDS